MNEQSAEPERQNDHARIARNTLTSYAVRALLALSALLLTPYLYRQLGAGGFGTWSVMFTVATVFSLLQEGFSAGVTKYVAEFLARDRRSDLQSTLSSAVVVMAVVGLAAGLVTVSVGLFATGLVPAAEQSDFRTGMLILGGATVLRFPCTAYSAALLGYQRYDLSNVSWMVTTVGFAVGAVIAVEAGTGVLGLAVAYAASLLIGAALWAVLLARTDRTLSLRPRLHDRVARRRIATFSFFALLADSMVFIGQRMDTVVIAAIRNAATAAPYAAAIKLQSGVQALTFPFVNLLMPMTSDLRARGEHDTVARRFMLTTRVALQITLPVAAAFAFFSTDFVDLWLGSSASHVTAEIISILMLVQIVTVSSMPAEKVLVGAGRVRAVGGLATIEGISNLGLSIALVSTRWSRGCSAWNPVHDRRDLADKDPTRLSLDRRSLRQVPERRHLPCRDQLTACPDCHAGNLAPAPCGYRAPSGGRDIGYRDLCSDCCSRDRPATNHRGTPHYP